MSGLGRGVSKFRKLAHGIDDGANHLKTINDELLFSTSSSKVFLGKTTTLEKLLKEISNDTHIIDVNGVSRQMVKHIDRPLSEIVRHVRMGNLDEVIKAYKNVADNVPVKRILNDHFNDATMKNNFKRLMENTYPDRKLFSASKKNKTFTKSKLKEAYYKDIDFDLEYGGLDKLYRTNKRFRKLIDNMENAPKFYKKPFIVVKGLFGTIVLGFGIYALFNSLVKQAKEMAGCWRVYITRSGEISACKITHCSCINKEYNPKNVCARLPKIENISSVCRGFPNPEKDIANAECRKCDVDAPENSQQYLSPEEMIDPKDVYLCRPQPNVGTLLSEFIADLPKQIWDGVNTTFDVLVDIFKYGAIFILSGFFVWIILKLWNWYKQITAVSDEDEKERSKLSEHYKKS